MAKKIAFLILTVILALGLFACKKEEQQVTVTFVGLDDKIETRTVTLGEYVEFPRNPEEDGLEFRGWFVEKNEAKTKVLRGFKPASDITLYAHFRELDFYTVTFVDHNNNIVEKVKVREDEWFDFVSSQPDLTLSNDKIFLGWSVEGDGTIVDYNYFAQNPVSGDLKLIAVTRDKIVYNITLMSGEDVYSTVKVVEGEEFKFDVKAPEKEDYEFIDWYLDAETTDNPYDLTRPEQDLTLYAHFSEIPLFDVYTNTRDNTCAINGLNPYYLDKTSSKATEIVIPEVIIQDGVEYKVIEICDNAFKGNENLKSISLPASITTIGASAFAYCPSLASITVDEENTVFESKDSNCIVTRPTEQNTTRKLVVGCKNTVIYNDINEISEQAFLGCSELTKLEIPASVSKLPEGFLTGCLELVELTVDAQNANYISVDNCVIRLSDTCLIQGCKTSVLPEKFTVGEEEKTITSISVKAFIGCETLTEINIPKSISTIKTNTFANCTALAKITINNPEITIEENAFTGCAAINDINVPYALAKTFLEQYKQTLTSVTLLDGEVIEKDLFAGCAALETVTLPATVTTIEANAFKDCTKLTAVTLKKDCLLKEIQANAFSGCTALVAFGIEKEENTTKESTPAFCIPASVETIGVSAFAGCKMSVLTFEEGASITTIDYKAFADCTALTEITLPTAVATVDYDAFNGCNNLKKATLSADVMRCLLVVGNSITELNIIAGETPDYETVRAMTNLETLSLSKDIKTVDARSLRACTKLVTITIAEENTALKVENDYVLEIATGKLLFAAAKSNVTISEKVKIIGAYAFVGTGIENIVIPETVEKIENYAFSACRSLTSLEILGKPVIEEFAFEGCDAIKTVKAYEFAYAYLNKVTIENKETIPEANA